MARTDADTVEGILMKDYDPDMSLEPFIRGANVMVNKVAECAASKGDPLSDEELLEIETWLAAHLYSCSDKPYEQKRTQQAWAKFSGKTGMHLESTHYGQTAMMFDSSGCLSALASKRILRMKWLGKPKSEEIPYRDRD